MRREVLAFLVLLAVLGSVAVAMAANDRVKPKQGGFPCPGKADTFVYGLGTKTHDFSGAGSGTDT